MHVPITAVFPDEIKVSILFFELYTYYQGVWLELCALRFADGHLIFRQHTFKEGLNFKDSNISAIKYLCISK